MGRLPDMCAADRQAIQDITSAQKKWAMEVSVIIGGRVKRVS